VEDFWKVYSFIIRVRDFPNRASLHFFVTGIKPTWEDEQNVSGGKFVYSTKDMEFGGSCFELLVWYFFFE
jgi:translation initiation factor 4E